MSSKYENKWEQDKTESRIWSIWTEPRVWLICICLARQVYVEFANEGLSSVCHWPAGHTSAHFRRQFVVGLHHTLRRVHHRLGKWIPALNQYLLWVKIAKINPRSTLWVVSKRSLYHILTFTRRISSGRERSDARSTCPGRMRCGLTEEMYQE